MLQGLVGLQCTKHAGMPTIYVHDLCVEVAPLSARGGWLFSLVCPGEGYFSSLYFTWTRPSALIGMATPLSNCLIVP